MNCSKCGYSNQIDDRFCKNCGSPLENNHLQETTNNINNQQINNSNGSLDSNNINKALTPNMKKWAILSIILPVIAIIWYWFIGLNTYSAVVIVALGFEFARRGDLTNRNLSTIGRVFNFILIGMTILMFIMKLAIELNNS